MKIYIRQIINGVLVYVELPVDSLSSFPGDGATLP